MPFGIGFDSGFDVDFDTDISVDIPDPTIDLPKGDDDSWYEVTWEYIEGGIDILGDATDILESWGVVGGNGDRQSADTRMQQTAEGWVDNLESWVRDTFGTVIGKESATQMLPWVLGGLAVIAIIILVKR